MYSIECTSIALFSYFIEDLKISAVGKYAGGQINTFSPVKFREEIVFIPNNNFVTTTYALTILFCNYDGSKVR